MAPNEIYDLLTDRASGTLLLEEVLIGLTWTLCRAGGVGLAMSPGIPTRTLKWSGTVRGSTVTRIASWLRSWDPYEAAVAMAAVNAVVNHDSPVLAQAQALSHDDAPANLAVFEWFKPELEGRRVVVVGRYPGLDRYAADLDLTVIERLPGPDDLPDPACEYVLPAAEWVFLTASSIPNKTFPRLAELARDARLVLMGPTVPWLAELSEFGVDYLAGVRIEAPDRVRWAVAEGAGTRLFECGARYCVASLARRSRS